MMWKRGTAAVSSGGRGRRVAMAALALAGAVSLGAVVVTRLDPSLRPGLLSVMSHRIEPLPAISSPRLRRCRPRRRRPRPPR